MRDFAGRVRTTRLPHLLGLAALVVAGISLSGCEVTETSGDYYRPGPVCPAIYAPVCAERRGELRTFPNACEARQSDWRIVANGQCRSGDYGDYRRDRDYRDRNSRDYSRERDYRRDYDRNRPDRFSTPIRPAPPRQPTAPVFQNPPMQPVAPAGFCPPVNEPVCGQLGASLITFPNRCELLRSGAVEVKSGQCGGGRDR